MIEPAKDAKKRRLSHSTERASNDPRARGNAATATANENVVSSDETTRRNRELDETSAASVQAEANAPTTDVDASDAGDLHASADNVPTVEASFKVSLQSKAAQDEAASEGATSHEAGAPDVQVRASNDPRAHPRGAARQAAGDDSGE